MGLLSDAIHSEILCCTHEKIIESERDRKNCYSPSQSCFPLGDKYSFAEDRSVFLLQKKSEAEITKFIKSFVQTRKITFLSIEFEILNKIVARYIDEIE